jgi:predicted Zn-dependent protease
VGIALATAQKGDYAQAAKLLREVLGKHPGLTWVYRALAAFSALAGDLETARDAVGKLLAAQPHVSIAAMRADHPMRSAPRFFDELVRGWRLAGLPET